MALYTTYSREGDKCVTAILIAGDFEVIIWKTKILDNESRESVAVSSKLLSIQSSDETYQLSKKFYLFKLKGIPAPTFSAVIMS